MKSKGLTLASCCYGYHISSSFPHGECKEIHIVRFILDMLSGQQNDLYQRASVSASSQTESNSSGYGYGVQHEFFLTKCAQEISLRNVSSICISKTLKWFSELGNMLLAAREVIIKLGVHDEESTKRTQYEPQLVAAIDFLCVIDAKISQIYNDVVRQGRNGLEIDAAIKETYNFKSNNVNKNHVKLKSHDLLYASSHLKQPESESVHRPITPTNWTILGLYRVCQEWRRCAIPIYTWACRLNQESNQYMNEKTSIAQTALLVQELRRHILVADLIDSGVTSLPNRFDYMSSNQSGNRIHSCIRAFMHTCHNQLLSRELVKSKDTTIWKEKKTELRLGYNTVLIEKYVSALVTSHEMASLCNSSFFTTNSSDIIDVARSSQFSYRSLLESCIYPRTLTPIEQNTKILPCSMRLNLSHEEIFNQFYHPIFLMNRVATAANKSDSIINLVQQQASSSNSTQTVSCRSSNNSIRSARLIKIQNMARHIRTILPPSASFILAVERPIQGLFKAIEKKYVQTMFTQHHLTKLHRFIRAVFLLWDPGAWLPLHELSEPTNYTTESNLFWSTYDGEKIISSSAGNMMESNKQTLSSMIRRINRMVCSNLATLLEAMSITSSICTVVTIAPLTLNLVESQLHSQIDQMCDNILLIRAMESVSIELKIAFPANIILTSEILKRYNNISKHLLSVHLLRMSTLSLWKQLRYLHHAFTDQNQSRFFYSGFSWLLCTVSGLWSFYMSSIADIYDTHLKEEVAESLAELNRCETDAVSRIEDLFSFCKSEVDEFVRVGYIALKEFREQLQLHNRNDINNRSLIEEPMITAACRHLMSPGAQDKCAVAPKLASERLLRGVRRQLRIRLSGLKINTELATELIAGLEITLSGIRCEADTM